MSEPELPSTELLARALEALNESGLADDLIKRARMGYYSDYGPLACPELVLMAELRERGYGALAERVADGEFDATAGEARAWAQSPVGQATFAELVRPRTPRQS